MMLRKRSRYGQKEQSGSRKTTLFSVPGVFVGFSSKNSSDSDPAKSPTSPLDYKLFNLSNPFLRSPRVDAPRRSWECDRPGLADALLERSNSSGILLGNQIRINISSPKMIANLPPKSLDSTEEGDLPGRGLGSSTSLLGDEDRSDSVALGKIQSCFTEFGRSSFRSQEFVYQGSKSSEVLMVESVVIREVAPGKLVGSLSASEIEESEDYTRITTHGPNPKTTHIFGDCILNCSPRELPNLSARKDSGLEPSSWFLARCPEEPPPLSFDFLSFCFSCKKKLEGQDIYIYRGEKAFCSNECREEAIYIEEREEVARYSPRRPMSSRNEDVFHRDMAESGTPRSR